ncbi:DUF308 domain-containing protein [Campylobacter sp. MIT 97-5078]|uniref:DUF308 domain-containing protein n=1 Tax=Campylobacter sp. MIT 97-5078 TaxID=1548153 RepID=UPI000512B427|nr:DUF308 domain-containing protein [Campylobacter sp. MIT 97-5078]KGI56795.1 hypothetical protein LR59_04715 [Campylobacter sp. MIT 97-5078]TQR27302.1 hypothetical protein DMB91_04750 [Campylobacter sp. MIT 97-5078]
MQIFMSICWIIFSSIITLVGFAGLFMPLGVFASFVVFLPFLLILSGISKLFYYLSFKDFSGANFILFDALMSFLFAIIFIGLGLELTSITIVMIVAFMSMFRGILSLSYVFELKKRGLGWLGLLVLALLNIIISLIFIIHPNIGGITIGFMIALMIFSFGLASLFGYFGVKKLLR